MSSSLLLLAETITHPAARSFCDSWASCSQLLQWCSDHLIGTRPAVSLFKIHEALNVAWPPALSPLPQYDAGCPGFREASWPWRCLCLWRTGTQLQHLIEWLSCTSWQGWSTFSYLRRRRQSGPPWNRPSVRSALRSAPWTSVTFGCCLPGFFDATGKTYDFTIYKHFWRVIASFALQAKMLADLKLVKLNLP